MRYKTEIFDNLLLMSEETKYIDHQLHFVIQFDGKLNASVMRKAFSLLLKVVPILACRYNHACGNDYWEAIPYIRPDDVLSITDNEAGFKFFVISKIDEKTGPQISACLYRADCDTLAVTMNHMICDASGFKQCLYLLADLYSNLTQNPDYSPGIVIDGDRGIRCVFAKISFWNKVKFLLQTKGNKRNNEIIFPTSADGNIAPFILAHTILPERYAMIHDYCKRNHVTVNDVLLTAYYRALSKMLDAGDDLNISIMVDMRKYLNGSGFTSLSNLTSTVKTHIAVDPSESFEDTLTKIHLEMDRKKENQIGMCEFVKTSTVFDLLPDRLCYRLVKNNPNNPNIAMTNIGILESDKLDFNGAAVESAFMTGSIKYRPHFQIAVSSFKNEMTFSINLYGSKQDQDRVLGFYKLLDNELPGHGCFVSAVYA